jgi:vancomycin resistance protein YoaR
MLRRWLSRFFASCAALALASPLALWGWLQLDASVFERARLGREHLPPLARLRPDLTTRAERWGSTEVVVHAGPYVARRTRAELGAALDVEPAIAWASSLGRSGNPLRDLATYWAARQETIERAWVPVVDGDQLGTVLASIRGQIERPPTPGTWARDGSLIAGIPGLTINSVSAVELIKRALRDGATSIKLDTTAIKPPDPIHYETLGYRIFTKQLHAFETKYAFGNAASGRKENIEASAKSIHGAIILPGDTLSFNELVGERTYERGYREAPELANGLVVDGIGGGICQVAATLHAAAFLAGMDVIEYQPHGRPVRYIDLGLDAMVAWPNKDLKIRNPYPFPVRVDSTADQGVARVVLYGAEKPHPVEWQAEVLERIAAGEKTITDPALPAGEQRLVQNAIEGLVIERRRTLYLPTGPVNEVKTVRYPPNPKIVAVGG